MLLTVEANESTVSINNIEGVSMAQYEAPSWKGKQPVRVRFGKRLNELRSERGYTQMQLAMQAGLDRSFVSDIERGVKEPTISTLELISITFNLTLSQLFEGV